MKFICLSWIAVAGANCIFKQFWFAEEKLKNAGLPYDALERRHGMLPTSRFLPQILFRIGSEKAVLYFELNQNNAHHQQGVYSWRKTEHDSNNVLNHSFSS